LALPGPIKLFRKGVPKRVVFGTYPLAAKAGVAMAFPKRAASSLTEEDEVRDHRC
jgi:hypothetical protein